MNLSIVTPSFNQADFIEETIKSVFDQRCKVEYLVVDGGSNDVSVEVIQRYEPQLAYWVSEPDRGQVHAISKGLERATGDIVAYLNSDDLYLPGAFAAVLDFFEENPAANWVCGDTILFGEGHPTELIKARVPKSAADCLCWNYQAPQPGMFWRRSLLTDGFSERWNYCFDHEFYVRLLLTGQKCHHLDLPVAAYRLHGTSKTIADAAKFDLEFDAIADQYETHLTGSERRWCRATRLLRQSYAAAAANRRDALSGLFRTMLIHPESILHRPFWGCLRQAVRRAN